MATDRELAQGLLCESFGPFGQIHLPYVKMGRIDSLDLFGITELIIFAFYWQNRNRYKKVLDIGANIGLHSILMDRLGWEVKAFEPDYEHFQHLTANLNANMSDNVKPYMSAMHTQSGEMNFVRVMNNLTGNHLEGYKDSYGPKETVIVPTVDCRSFFTWSDLAKIDSEGNEADLLMTITARQMTKLDIIVEVRNEKNAKYIFQHFQRLGVPMWSQKNGWFPVERLEQMPHVNREGSLFIGHRAPFDLTTTKSGSKLLECHKV